MNINKPEGTKELLIALDVLAGINAITAVGAVAFEAAKCIRRLLAGDFTKREIHNFCHKLPETVSSLEFASGCMAYQTELYGSSTVMELLRDTDKLLASWGIPGDHETGSGTILRKRIREQIL